MSVDKDKLDELAIACAVIGEQRAYIDKDGEVVFASGESVKTAIGRVCMMSDGSFCACTGWKNRARWRVGERR